MSWLLIVICAYLLFAVVFVVDKYVLTKTPLSPTTATFYVGLLGIFALVLIPIQFFIPSWEYLAISLLAGVLYLLASLFFYKAVRAQEVTRVTAFIGSLVPIFTFVLAYFFLDDRLTRFQFIAFVLLIVGGVMIIWPGGNILKFFSIKLAVVTASAFLFAASFVASKYVFDAQPFWNSFIWMRIGGFLGACALFLWPGNRAKISTTNRKIEKEEVGLFVVNKVVAAGAFILQNYAIALGSVILVNALQGIQYVFLLGFTLFLSWKFPRILREKMGRGLLIQKIIAILLVGMGLGLLAI